MSTLFNLRPPVKVKPITSHPWEKTIKDVYSNEIKYAHNSIKNPHYPKKKKKSPDEDIVKFSVIGDRVTKEFIYCAKLVSGLHKYRSKKFDVPEIKGVTSVEWPDIWHSLKIQYGGLAHCIQSRVAVLMNGNFLGSENELKELIELKYIYHLQLDYYNEAISNFATYIRSSGRPCAYMHISINTEPVGTMIFMLYSDLLPYTCENFLRLCNARKGGYSGTPVHRIVKDGWIQCGGFGLKNTDLECENFMIPHDRRGVLCMANDDRHVDCSTQFFVLLQPAPWMAQKYVAFGQLIEGEQTLNKIEEQPTWYESPTNEIIIFKAGILNLECHDITVNKGTNEYIHMHIEDLFALGELLIEALMERVFLEAELRVVQRLEKEMLGEEEETVENVEGDVHRTRRFLRKRNTGEGEPIYVRSQSVKSATVPKPAPVPPKEGEQENNDFDVEEYELEESIYHHMSIPSQSESLVVKPEKPYYLALTDVPYPGEKDSTYDIKKFLKGDYCLESDIDPNAPKKSEKTKAIPSNLLNAMYDVSESASSESLNSEDEREVRDYLRANADRVSFAGGIVKSIAKGYVKYLMAVGKGETVGQITEDQMRRVRLASADQRMAAERYDTKVKIAVSDERAHRKIKRRQTGFVNPNVLAQMVSEQAVEEEEASDEDGAARKVRMAASATAPTFLREPRIPRSRRPTGFIRMMEVGDSDSEMDLNEPRDSHRPSAMQRLYDESRIEYEPTLKTYKTLPEYDNKVNMLLTFTPHYMKSEESEINKLVLRKPQDTNDQLFDDAMELQHNKKLVRKISSDYVKTFHTEKFENSIRSIEYAKARPAMTVSAYQLKNLKHQEELKKKAEQSVSPQPEADRLKGLRLPGDSPCYSPGLICSPSLASVCSYESYTTAEYVEE